MDWRDSVDPFFRSDERLERMFEILSELESEGKETEELVHSFVSNLQSAVDVAEMPATVAALTTLFRRKSNTSARDAIRPRGSQPGGQELSDEERFRRAQDRMDVTLSLVRPDRDPELIRCIETSLRQALVLLWGTFEIFANDLAEFLLNVAPELIGSDHERSAEVLRSLKARGVSKAAIEELRGHSQPGTALVETRRLQSFTAIRSFFEATLGLDASANEALSSSDLLDLEQRRHVIVHRAGIVDSSYVAKTRSKQLPGEVIDVSPRLFKESFGSTGLAAMQLGLGVLGFLAARESRNGAE